MALTAFNSLLNNYLSSPTFKKLEVLISEMTTDEEFNELFMKSIDSPAMYLQLSDLEKGILFHISEHLVEAEYFFTRQFELTPNPFLADKLFRISIERHNLDLAYEYLQRIQENAKSYDKILVEAYKTMFCLVSGRNDLVGQLGWNLYHLKPNNIEIYELAVEASLRVADYDLLVKLLNTPVLNKKLSVGRNQNIQIKNNLKSYLIQILRRRL